MYTLIPSVAAGIGLIISLYLYIQKRMKRPLMCPRKAPCEQVTGSKYANTFGISNDVLGIGYFAVVAILFALVPVAPSALSLALVVIVSGGVLFSLYLIAVQAFIIRAWCMWCLSLAVINIGLVVALFWLPRAGMYELLGVYRTVVIIAHNIGFILGLGAATITDILFLRFLRDEQISEHEKGTMDTLSSVIWVGLGILIISGLLLYLPEQARLASSSKFLLKLVVVGVVTVNGVLLNILVAPRMMSFSFHPDHAPYRRLAYALGGISITSWYSAFILGSIRKIPVSFALGVKIYGALLLVVIIGSQLQEWYSSRVRKSRGQ